MILKNLFKLTIFSLVLSFIVACGASRKTTGPLQSPNYGGSKGESKTKETKEKELAESERKKLKHEIALLLPFQLDKVDQNNLNEEDVKRSALALDFYQGFQLGIESSLKNKENFTLHVLDSRDQESHIANLSKSFEITNSQLIIGPVYPSEIKSLKANISSDSSVLVVSPLAATSPIEFEFPQLVSITPPLSAHMRRMAALIESDYKFEDQIIIYNVSNTYHTQFIDGFVSEIKERIPDVKLVSVSTPLQLKEAINTSFTNHILTGTTDINQIKEMIEVLDDANDSYSLNVNLYGHPLWDKLDFSKFYSFSLYNPRITSESTMTNFSSKGQKFIREYKNMYEVDPSEYSYKGYDAGVYFAKLLEKYGQDYAKHLVETTQEGIYSEYKFNKNDRWGYVNFGLSIKRYQGGEFRLR